MKKYEYQSSIRFSEPVRESLEEICDTYRINESDYIRISVQRCLMNDMQENVLTPRFPVLGELICYSFLQT
jgi:hypothetical protein